MYALFAPFSRYLNFNLLLPVLSQYYQYHLSPSALYFELFSVSIATDAPKEVPAHLSLE